MSPNCMLDQCFLGTQWLLYTPTVACHVSPVSCIGINCAIIHYGHLQMSPTIGMSTWQKKPLWRHWEVIEVAAGLYNHCWFKAGFSSLTRLLLGGVADRHVPAFSTHDLHLFPQRARPLSVPFLFCSSGKGTDTATMLRLEKYGRIESTPGRWTTTGQNALLW